MRGGKGCGGARQDEDDADAHDGHADSDDPDVPHEPGRAAQGRRKGGSKGGKKAAHVGDEVEMRIVSDPATRCPTRYGPARNGA